jgi:hypothetical protein
MLWIRSSVSLDFITNSCVLELCFELCFCSCMPNIQNIRGKKECISHNFA